jgi:uncharacterized protein YndB with AHSA1/START domain
MNDNTHVSVIYIKTEPETLWQALTSPEFTSQYLHATSVESDFKRGSSVTFYNADRTIAIAGEVLEVEEFKKLSFTWHVHYNPEAIKEEPSRVTYLLEKVEEATKLTLIHDNFPSQSVVYPVVNEGWIPILSNLKTLLETGRAMSIS